MEKMRIDKVEVIRDEWDARTNITRLTIELTDEQMTALNLPQSGWKVSVVMDEGRGR